MRLRRWIRHNELWNVQRNSSDTDSLGEHCIGMARYIGEFENNH